MLKLSIRLLFKGLFRRCGCGYCDCLIPIIDKYGIIRKYKNGHVIKNTIRKTGSDHPNWKGGKSNRYEYIVIHKPHFKYSNPRGYVSEHRYIMYLYLSILNGKPTYIEGFDIHHKNGNKKDNRISNLQLISKSEHGYLTNKGKKKDKSERICNICKLNVTAKRLKNGEYYDDWRNDINGFLCKLCYNMIRRYMMKLIK